MQRFSSCLRLPLPILVTLLFILYLIPHRAVSQLAQVGTLAGSGGFRDAVGKIAQFNGPASLALYQNLLYIADLDNGRIRRLNLNTGQVTTVVDNLSGLASIAIHPTGDTLYYIAQVPLTANTSSTAFHILDLNTNDLNTFAGLSLSANAASMVVDKSGIVYITDTDNHRITMFSLRMGFPTLAGTFGLAGSKDTLAMAATFNRPQGLVFNPDQTILYVSDAGNNRIRAIDLSQGRGLARVSTIATGINLPGHLDLNITADSLITAATESHQIWKIALTDGAASPVAGMAGTAGFADTVTSASLFNKPWGIVQADSASRAIYISDFLNNRIRRIADGQINTVAGSGSIVDDIGTLARLNNPHGMAVDEQRNILYFTDTNAGAVRKMDLQTNLVTTLSTRFKAPMGLTVSATGDSLFVTDRELHKLCIVEVSSGATSDFVGAGLPGFKVGIGEAALLNTPTDVTRVGNTLFVVDRGNLRIRRVVIPTAEVQAYAGEALPFGSVGAYYDSPYRDQANFVSPLCITNDGRNLYITDANRIRKIANVIQYDDQLTSLNPITTLAGNSVAGSANGTGTAASLNRPYGICYDGSGYLYVTTVGDRALRRISIGTKQVTTFLSTPTAGTTNGPQGIARFSDRLRQLCYRNNKLFVADAGNNLIRFIDFIPNSPPTFTLGSDILVSEDLPIQTVSNFVTNISPGPFATDQGQTVTLKINTSDRGMFAQLPALTANGTLTFRTAKDVFGVATVTVQAQDNGGTEAGGIDTSATQSFKIYINNAPDAPVVSPSTFQNRTVARLTPTTYNFTVQNIDGPIDLINLSATASDTALFPPRNITFSGTGSDRSITLIPADYHYGSATISLRIGNADTAAYRSFIITVPRYNTSPSFTAGPSVVTDEDLPLQTFPNWVSNIRKGRFAADSGQTLTFIVSNSNPALFERNAQPTINSTNGTLTFKTAPNAYGTAFMYISLKDNGGTQNKGSDTSPTDTVMLTINPHNDAPAFGTWREDRGLNNIKNINSGGIITLTESALSNKFYFSISDIDNPNADLKLLVSRSGTLGIPLDSLFLTSAGSNYTLRFRAPARVYGRDTIRVTLSDLNTQVQFMLIAYVAPFNTPPDFTLGYDTLTYREDTPALTVTNFVRNIKKGISNAEDNQVVTFSISTDNPTLFSILPIIGPSNAANVGALTFSLARNRYGSARVFVKAKDNGNQANATLRDTSLTKSFVIRVLPINDVPEISALSNVSLIRPQTDTIADTLPIVFRVTDLDSDISASNLQFQYDTSLIKAHFTMMGAEARLVLAAKPWTGDPALCTDSATAFTITATDDSSAITKATFAIALTDGCLVGINPLAQPVRVQVYPNPFNDRLCIQLQHIYASPVQISLLDLFGRTIKQVVGQNDSTDPIKLQLSDLPAGAYWLRFQFGNRQQTVPIVKY